MENITLNSLAEIVSGYAIPSSAMSEEGIPVIKITNIKECGTLDLINTVKYSKPLSKKLTKFLLQDKDALVCMTGATIGKVARKIKVDGQYIVNQRVAIIRAKNIELQDYVYYVLTLPAFRKYVEVVGYGAAQPNISSVAIGKFSFGSIGNPILQCRIGSVLSTYDTLIENNTKRIRLLEKMAENLYKEWFVRFRFPGHEKVEMKNGLPKGWEYVKLFDMAEVMYGFAFKSNRFCEDSTLNPVVRIRDIQDNHTNTFTDEECDDKYLIRKNAILIGMDGIFHMCLWNGERAYLNQRVVMLSSIETSFCNYLLFLSIRPQIKYWEQVISGTTVAHLGDKHLKRVRVLVPTSDILNKANNLVEEVMEKVNNLQHQNSLLARQRDHLLPRLMSGKLEV